MERAIPDWNGFGTLRLSGEAPAVGNEHSTYVSGRCTVPHAMLDLSPVESDNYVKLRFFGKNLKIGGGLLLENVDTGKLISVHITDSVWTSYESSEKLYLRSGDRLQLSMSSGGFFWSAMLVDLLEVTVVE